MFVCICNGYRESEIVEVAKEGLGDVQEVYLCLGSGPCCGRCLEHGQAVIDRALAALTTCTISRPLASGLGVA